MTQICGNHVALVKKGRAGPDVVVGDAALKELEPMKLDSLGLDEIKHDPHTGQFSSGGGGSSGAASGVEKTKISVAALKTKLEAMPHAKLMSALKNESVDPAIKKHIEKELDSRANRGTSKGFGEDSQSQEYT